MNLNSCGKPHTTPHPPHPPHPRKRGTDIFTKKKKKERRNPHQLISYPSSSSTYGTEESLNPRKQQISPPSFSPLSSLISLRNPLNVHFAHPSRLKPSNHPRSYQSGGGQKRLIFQSGGQERLTFQSGGQVRFQSGGQDRSL